MGRLIRLFPLAVIVAAALVYCVMDITLQYMLGGWL